MFTPILRLLEEPRKRVPRRRQGLGAKIRKPVLNGPHLRDREREQANQYQSDLSLKYDVAIPALYMSEQSIRTEHSPLMLNVRREGVSA